MATTNNSNNTTVYARRSLRVIDPESEVSFNHFGGDIFWTCSVFRINMMMMFGDAMVVIKYVILGLKLCVYFVRNRTRIEDI